ncbi:hypothetical protein KCP78_07325 [Salmonella enterica subsp. enterica]|nr:hypothetical protein KCP78_07325 [Salmonella enterica subsp. enterica]
MNRETMMVLITNAGRLSNNRGRRKNGQSGRYFVSHFLRARNRRWDIVRPVDAIRADGQIKRKPRRDRQATG